ncbi:diamine N-acetyltransferase [Parabacteroides sp. PFB2-10]|uniref:GNAT family N-acetyltransferase n=1 Tax=Parabacteroides sp. PFB2-10 TaxID=1742405 RepID=UPI00247425CF|nr:GNAT family N-acetyltransferase [Parabacteroides sp. PFB2-10]MDH6314207.1 diamine N-acetyltransferase [Parabacteroides sp. PFB2-10]
MSLLQNNEMRLRALEPEDLDRLYHWENDSALWSVSNTLAPYSQYVLREYIAESRRDIYELKQLRLMIEITAEHKTIGMIDLFDFDPHNRRAGVGILIDPACQQNGWATEALRLLIEYAFSFLKLHQLYAHIPETNVRSRSLFLRCGFNETGCLADWITTEEEGYEDVIVVQLQNPS